MTTSGIPFNVVFTSSFGFNPYSKATWQATPIKVKRRWKNHEDDLIVEDAEFYIIQLTPTYEISTL